MELNLLLLPCVSFLGEHVDISGVKFVARFCHGCKPDIVLQFFLLFLETLRFRVVSFLLHLHRVWLLVAIFVTYKHVQIRIINRATFMADYFIIAVLN